MGSSVVVDDAVSPADGPVSPFWVARYLTLLGVDNPRPDRPTLRRLTRAHLAAVPFDNTTAILRRHAHAGRPVPPPDPEALLTAWGSGRGGGVCFDVTPTFGRLLTALGFRARLVLGAIGAPGGHQALLVEVGGGRFLVDVANGAPFFEPIPLDGSQEVRRAGLAYRFRPGDDPDHWVQDRRIDGDWQPFCVYDLRPADPAVRDVAYQRNHAPGNGWVVDRLTLIRCRDDEVLMLRDDEFTRISEAGKRVERLPDPRDRARLAADAFGVPAWPIAAALDALADLAAAAEDAAGAVGRG